MVIFLIFCFTFNALFKQEESLDADVAALQLLLSPFALLKDTDSNSKYIKTDKLKE